MATNHEVRGSNPLRCDLHMIQTFTSGPVNTNSYLLLCPKTREAAIIDAPQGASAMLLKAIQQEQLTVSAIFITHSHWDHIADCPQLKKMLNVPLYIHKRDAPNLKNPGSDKLPLFFPIEGVTADGFLTEGDIFHVGKLEIHVIDTPGHSPGGICLWIPQEKILFSGDTLFQGTMGRVDFPTSSPSDMRASLKKLSQLPPETKVYPGHGPATTIGEEAWISSI